MFILFLFKLASVVNHTRGAVETEKVELIVQEKVS